MGTKYETILVGGVVQTYNDGPPSDDGSQTEANRVKYSTITSDLSAPLHSAITSMDAKLLLQTDEGPLAKSGTYPTTLADHNKVIECTGTFTLTLLTPSGNAGYQVTAKNAGSGLITVVSASGTIDGAASITLGAGDSVKAYVNAAGTAYYTTAHGGLGISAATKMLFYQAAAPTGWTIDSALDEHAVRLTSSIGGTKGGTNNFSTQFVLSAESGFVGDKAIDVTQIPAHDHGGAGAHNHNWYSTTNSAGTSKSFMDTTIKQEGTLASNNPDGGSTKILAAEANHTHTSVGGGLGHSHTVDLRVKWAACIVATKD